MPCNLAVSITKGVISQEFLLKILKENPRIVGETFKAYFSNKYPNKRVSYSTYYKGEVQMHVGGERFSILEGKIYVEKSGEQYLAESEQLLQIIADNFFNQHLETLLPKLGTLTKKDIASVRDVETTVTATVFHLTCNGLPVRIFSLPGSKLQVFVDGGAFEQARITTLALFNALQTQGLPVSPTSEVESHRNSEHVHVLTHHHGH